ncbi:MAG: DHH family phosphoesterase [Oscillospiraceae bacterium]|nr:DHH family phosphoesterase [Oscillospiraceae bacterium]
MNFKDCAKLLAEHDNILLLTHKNPDGDTMSSAAALCSALRRTGKTAWLYPNRAVIKNLRPYVEEFFAPEGFEGEYTVAVDAATDSMFAEGFTGKADLCVDHHPTNSHYAARELIRDDRSSCGEIVLDLIKAMCGSPSKQEATLLYIAVTTDTGCFQYANTSAKTFSAAAELLRFGADNREISTVFFRRMSRARMKLEGLIYSGMTFYRDGKISVATITREMLEDCSATEDDCDDLAGLAGRAEGNVVSITIKELEDGTSKISVRSNPEVSSSDICAVFGGGGHAMAAGCNIAKSPDKAREMLMDVIDEVWK